MIIIYIKQMFLDLRLVNLIDILASLVDRVLERLLNLLRLNPSHNSHVFQSFLMHAFKVVLAESVLDFGSCVDFTFT